MDQEEDLHLVLSGGNQVKYGQVFRWATDIVVGFPGLKEDLRVRTYDFSPNRAFKDYPVPSATIKALRDSKINLKSLAEFYVNERIKLPRPVEVFVIAKRKVSVTVYNSNRGALFIGTVIVGDDTGYIELTMFNDAIESIYNLIDVRDRILITGGLVLGQAISDHHCMSLFPKEMRIGIEIKPNVFDARKIYIVKDISNHKLPFSFQSIIGSLKGSFAKLWTATDILSEENEDILFETVEGGQEVIINLDNYEDRKCINIDIIGIVKHVGRLERRAKWKVPTRTLFKLKDPIVDSDHPAHDQEREYQQYSAFRWIELIDVSQPGAQPLRVQMFINDMKTWKSQENLTPGSLIIITHCTPRLSFLGKSMRTTAYSVLHTDSIIEFLKKYPRSYFDSVRATYFNRAHWKNIIETVKFTIGGAYCVLCEKETLTECRPTACKCGTVCNGTGTCNLITYLSYPRQSFLPNEVQRIVCTGRIRNSIEIDHNTSLDIFSNKEAVSQFGAKGPDYSFTPLISYETFQLWSCSRKLPKIRLESREYSQNDIMDEISKEYKTYAKLSTKDILDTAGKLELAEEQVYYLLEIENSIYNWVYKAYWIGRSKEETQEKLRASEGKDLDIMIDIQQIEIPTELEGISRYEYEIIVHDFMPIVV